MTAHKHLKRRVRERMSKTGDGFATARRHIVAKLSTQDAHPDPRFALHFPGCVPGATALRSLLAAAGVRDRQTGASLSEAMCFGLAGGLGIGIFAFHYAKENFSSFFIAGRHLWHDNLAFLTRALGRLGLKPEVLETSSAKAAEKNLQTALAAGRPVVAWVDAAHLPHRAMPAHWSGGGYHIVTVHALDEHSGAVWIGDLADQPVAIDAATFAQARSRIAKHKNRILTVEGENPPEFELRPLAAAAIRACRDGLMGLGKDPAIPANARKNFALAVLPDWAGRIHGAKGKDSWSVIFPPGRLMWQGLTSLYDFAEHYGTGGGLCRPLYAQFLSEAAEALGDKPLAASADTYARIGAQWTALAEAALPSDVPRFAEARELLQRKAELTFSGEPEAPAEIASIWTRLDELSQAAERAFPLPAAQVDVLRADLAERVRTLHQAECEAIERLGAWAEASG